MSDEGADTEDAATVLAARLMDDAQLVEFAMAELALWVHKDPTTKHHLDRFLVYNNEYFNRLYA